MRHTVVLGAGIQGATVALALAEAGHRVTVVDRADGALTRASLKNEGKIHLGFVYAHDTSCRTSSLMLDAALAFAPLIERWVGRPVPWADMAGAPFSYLILRDSIVPESRILAAWSRLQSKFESRQVEERSYLRTTPDRLWWPMSSGEAGGLYGPNVGGHVQTAELALDMQRFQPLMRQALAAAPGVECLFGRDVREVARTPAGFGVEGSTASGDVWHLEADAVVNCLWEGRLAIDQQLGLLPRRPWVYRLKYRILADLPPALRRLPSLTLMLGKYGDIVNYGDGRAYLSWYPACLCGWSGEVAVPAEWERACRGQISDEERTTIAAQSLEAFDAIVPGLRACRVTSVAAGVIFSWGETDIDDPSSELHRRDEIGPEAHDGYVTVNTGKLTTAPLFASRVPALLA